MIIIYQVDPRREAQRKARGAAREKMRLEMWARKQAMGAVVPVPPRRRREVETTMLLAEKEREREGRRVCTRRNSLVEARCLSLDFFKGARALYDQSYGG